MDNINHIIAIKNEEVRVLYESKMHKNKKMTLGADDIDYNSKKTRNQINAYLDKKHKSTKAYQKQIEKELLEKAI